MSENEIEMIEVRRGKFLTPDEATRRGYSTRPKTKAINAGRPATISDFIWKAIEFSVVAAISIPVVQFIHGMVSPVVHSIFVGVGLR